MNLNSDNFCVMIDPGHGENTPGKRSPDGRLREYAYCRDIANRIADKLRSLGIHCEILVPEKWDVTLEERVKRCNNFCKQNGKDNCLFVSVHNNAAGSGGWMSARGWSVFVYRNGSERSRKFADMLFDAATELGVKTRKPQPKQKYWDCGFYVCKHTNCAAVLTENMFQDNKEDVEWLLSDAGRSAISALHVKAIVNYYTDLYGEPLPAVYEGCNMK